MIFKFLNLDYNGADHGIKLSSKHKKCWQICLDASQSQILATSNLPSSGQVINYRSDGNFVDDNKFPSLL